MQICERTATEEFQTLLQQIADTTVEQLHNLLYMCIRLYNSKGQIPFSVILSFLSLLEATSLIA